MGGNSIFDINYDCNSGYGVGVCDGDFTVSAPTEPLTTAEPYTDEYDPGCRALRQGQFFFPMDMCLAGAFDSDGSIIYECNAFGTVALVQYSSQDCSGEPTLSYNDFCAVVDGTDCAAYCGNSNECTNVGTNTVYSNDSIDCSGDVESTLTVLLDECAPFNGTQSFMVTCDGTTATTYEYDSLDCDGNTVFNTSEYSVGECNEERDGTSLFITCDASPPTPEPTTPMPTNDESDTTMDGTDDTIVDDTQTTDDVDPTVDGSSAFAVSKVIAVILSVVGTVYFV